KNRSRKFRALQVGPVQPVRKGVCRLQDLAEQFDNAVVATAVACNDETETIACVDETLREFGVLCRKISRKILQAVVSEIAVKLAVKRVFFIVQRLLGVVSALNVISAQRFAAYRGDGFLNDGVKIRAKGDTAK